MTFVETPAIATRRITMAPTLVHSISFCARALRACATSGDSGMSTLRDRSRFPEPIESNRHVPVGMLTVMLY